MGVKRVLAVGAVRVLAGDEERAGDEGERAQASPVALATCC